MSPATKTSSRPTGTSARKANRDRGNTPPAGPHIADSHDLIRVLGARQNNLKDISVEIPKRRLTAFTGV